MKQGRWVALLVLALGVAVYGGARDAQQRLPRPPPLPAAGPSDDFLTELGVEVHGLREVPTGVGTSEGPDAVRPRLDAAQRDALEAETARLSRQRAVEDGLAEMAAAEEQQLLNRRRFDDQWKSIMSDLADARLVTVDTVVFPDDWLDDVRGRFWNRICRTRLRALAPSNFTPPAEVYSPKPSWKRAAATPNAVRLTVGDDDELPLEAMDITVKIEGFRARVVLDCFFRNNREKRLNGAFALRLPTGASPHYFAFGRTQLATRMFRPHAVAALTDIRAARTPTWDAPKEARMVARETAAHAFTETVHRRIDPALMEWSGAGVFSAQVFPLEPGALHHIAVAYDTNLLQDGENLIHRLELPRGVPSLDVEIAARDGAPVTPASSTLADARRRLTHPKAKAVVTTIACPAPVVLTGESSEAGALFATEFVPVVPDVEAATSPRAVFLLDVSASSTPERFNTWLALLESVLRENRETLQEFAVLCFNVESFWWKPDFQPNDDTQLLALRTFTDDLLLEGATDLGAALATAGSVEGAFDVFLLSDGGVTWGEINTHALASGLDVSHPLFGYVVPGGGADVNILQHLARRSGGAVFSVNTEAEVRVAARAHRKRPWQIEGVSVDGGSDLLLAGRPSALFPGQTLRLVGRGAPEADAQVVLQLSQGSATRTVKVPLGRRLDSALTARTYGEVAVSQLESLGEAAATEARAYAAHFRVVGSSCSLLMLESEEEYKRRGVSAEDLTPVKNAPAASVVAEHLASAETALADPKRRFLAMLDRLAHLPEVMRLTVPPELRAYLESLPGRSFVVERPRLEAKLRTAAGVPASVREALAARDLSYTAAVAEATRREKIHGDADALKALSTLVEQHPGDLTLARDVAFSALAWQRRTDAYHLLRRVASHRPWERPTWLAIARCLDGLGKTDLALVFYELALTEDQLARYGALPQVAALDYGRLLRAIAQGTRTSALAAYAKARLPSVIDLGKLGEADLLVVLEWNTDRTDVDLHVTDPAGEHCYYKHRSTEMGGQLSTDVTTGFGPELFVLPMAEGGTYEIEVHYFGSDALRTKARSKIYARIYEDWGRPTERVRRVALTLKDENSRYAIGIVKR